MCRLIQAPSCQESRTVQHRGEPADDDELDVSVADAPKETIEIGHGAAAQPFRARPRGSRLPDAELPASRSCNTSWRPSGSGRNRPFPRPRLQCWSLTLRPLRAREGQGDLLAGRIALFRQSRTDTREIGCDHRPRCTQLQLLRGDRLPPTLCRSK
jgi:hypothetical protein